MLLRTQLTFGSLFTRIKNRFPVSRRKTSRRTSALTRAIGKSEQLEQRLLLAAAPAPSYDWDQPLLTVQNNWVPSEVLKANEGYDEEDDSFDETRYTVSDVEVYAERVNRPDRSNAYEVDAFVYIASANSAVLSDFVSVAYLRKGGEIIASAAPEGDLLVFENFYRDQFVTATGRSLHVSVEFEMQQRFFGEENLQLGIELIDVVVRPVRGTTPISANDMNFVDTQYPTEFPLLIERTDVASSIELKNEGTIHTGDTAVLDWTARNENGEPDDVYGYLYAPDGMVFDAAQSSPELSYDEYYGNIYWNLGAMTDGEERTATVVFTMEETLAGQTATIYASAYPQIEEIDRDNNYTMTSIDIAPDVAVTNASTVAENSVIALGPLTIGEWRITGSTLNQSTTAAASVVFEVMATNVVLNVADFSLVNKSAPTRMEAPTSITTTGGTRLTGPTVTGVFLVHFPGLADSNIDTSITPGGRVNLQLNGNISGKVGGGQVLQAEFATDEVFQLGWEEPLFEGRSGSAAVASVRRSG